MAITFQVTGQGTPALPFVLSVVGSAISVQLNTDGSGNAITTCNAMGNALAASPAVAALGVTVSSIAPLPTQFNSNFGPANVSPSLSVIILGEVFAFALSAPLPAGNLTLTFKGMKVYPPNPAGNNPGGKQ